MQLHEKYMVAAASLVFGSLFALGASLVPLAPLNIWLAAASFAVPAVAVLSLLD